MSGQFDGFVLLALLWFLVNMITRVGRKPNPRARAEPPPEPVSPRFDPTQHEGLRLEATLGDLRRALEDAAQPAWAQEQPVARRLESWRAEGSRELEPEARSLEDGVQREL